MPLARKQRLLEDALQLPDIARPRVGAQPLERLWGGLAHVAPQFAAETPQKVPDEQRQVIAALPQWRASGW